MLPHLPVSSSPARRLRALPAVLLTLMLSALVLGLAPAAQADGPQEADAPVRLVLTTAGLSWEDISAERTPNIQCLADRSGAGAMNTTSTSVVSTERQGLETLHTGYRGLAEKAPRSAEIPNPPVDQWKQLPVHTTEIDASAEADPELAGSGPSDPDQIAAQTADALAGEDIVQVDLGSVPDHDDPGREQALSDLDERVGGVLDAAGGCESADLPRTLLV
ncbi:MAG: hypothetical protein ACTIAR_17390, partial [Brachybacterium tyrofermentans]